MMRGQQHCLQPCFQLFAERKEFNAKKLEKEKKNENRELVASSPSSGCV
jgi:hypothetical protein